MAANISADEQEQILQTIEMFEVITEMNPDDYQSLLLLKEAYGKLGRAEESVKTSCQIVEAFMRLDQLDSAGDELQGLASLAPNNPQVRDLLDSYRASGGRELNIQDPPQPDTGLIESNNGFEDLDFSILTSADTALTETEKTSRSGKADLPGVELEHFQLPSDDGLDPLADFLRDSSLATPDAIKQALKKTRNSSTFNPDQVAVSLLQEVIKQGTNQDEEQILLSILDYTKLGFVPLEHYELDREVVNMLPKELTLGRHFVPFELISRTIMIALGNPFDAPAKKVCQSLLDYNIKWYFARPQAIADALRFAYKLN